MIFFRYIFCAVLFVSFLQAPLEGRRKRRPQPTELMFEEGASILENKIPKKDKRYFTFLRALLYMKERNVQTIVETGTARDGLNGCIGDGCSTCIFSEWAELYGASFYSVDINDSNLREAKKALNSAETVSHLILSDSVEFLQNFGRPIDFLYLDSYDFEWDNPIPSQQHHLSEIIAAYPWLHENSVVMIDDCDLPHGGKGKLVIEFLLSRGWKITAKKYQVIMVRN